MVRLAWLLTGSREVAEDLVQDAFLRVDAAWSRVESPEAYLRTAVVNGVRGRARRARVEANLRFDEIRPLLAPELDEVWTELEHLPVRQRQALVLRFYADLPFVDIADHLGCQLGTAKSLVHRGLAKLKELLDQ